MKVKLKKPWGMHGIGKILEPRNESLAKMLIRNNFADRVKDEKPKPEVETAEAPAVPETAAVRTKKPRRKRKAHAETEADNPTCR